MSFGSLQRRKTPEFASSLDQNSTRRSKSLNLFLLTMKLASLPAFLSATTAPSSTRQLLSPSFDHSSNFEASRMVVHPSAGLALVGAVRPAQAPSVMAAAIRMRILPPLIETQSRMAFAASSTTFGDELMKRLK